MILVSLLYCGVMFLFSVAVLRFFRSLSHLYGCSLTHSLTLTLSLHCFSMLSCLCAQNSWKLVSDRKWETLRSLNALMSPDQNQGKYRKVFGHCSLPAIPFQAVLLRDLTFIEDGNRTFVDEEGTLINLRKMELLAKVVQSVLKMQHITYDYRVEPVVHLWYV
jgi:RasGEF domain